MYRNQTNASLTRDSLMIAFMPALVILGVQWVTFAYVAHAENVEGGYPWGFIAIFTGLALVAGVGAGLSNWLEGPKMVKMTPAEEAAKKAEIRADAEAHMAALKRTSQRVGPNPFSPEEIAKYN